MGRRIDALARGLSEALFGTPKEPKPISEGTAIFHVVEQAYGVRMDDSFASQVKVYREDPVVGESIRQSAQEIISTGIFTTIDKEYKTDLPTPDGKGRWTAKEAIDVWNRDNDIDTKVLQMAIEIIAFGNTFWNITTGGFVNVPIESIEKAKIHKKGVPLREQYNLETTAVFGSKTLKFGEFVHGAMEKIGKGALGTGGIIQGLIKVPDAIGDLKVPSLYEIRKAVRASMKEGFVKFSFGNELWYFEDMSDEKLTEISEDIEEMGSTGVRIVSNKKGDIRLAVPQRTQSYDKWIEQVHFEFLMALANPSLKLGLEQGFTKATAEAARELYEMKIAAARRIIKRMLEGVWRKVLDKLGFDGEAANPRLHFGSQDIEYVTADVFAAVDKRIIKRSTAQAILRKYMKWEIPDDDVPDEKPEPAAPAPVPGPEPGGEEKARAESMRVRLVEFILADYTLEEIKKIKAAAGEPA